MEFNDFFSTDKIYITVAVLSTLLLFFVSVLIGITTRRRQREAIDHFKYRPRKHLMVGPTRQCFQILNNLFGQTFYIIPDVQLSSLLSHKVGLQDRYAAYRFIDHKTVDFVLCNKHTLRPVCAVKLEDGTKSKEPGNNPEDMDKFFRSAHLPFVYLARSQKLTETYIIEELSRIVYEVSQIKPAPRGRRKASDTTSTTPDKSTPDKSTRTSRPSVPRSTKTKSSKSSSPKPPKTKSTRSRKTKTHLDDDLLDDELEKYFF